MEMEISDQKSVGQKKSRCLHLFSALNKCLSNVMEQEKHFTKQATSHMFLQTLLFTET